MMALMDSIGIELEAKRRRTALGVTMQASRRGTLRRPLGTWLQGVGLRLAPDALRPATDCP